MSIVILISIVNIENIYKKLFTSKNFHIHIIIKYF